MQRLEVAGDDDQGAGTSVAKTGVWKKLKQRLQKNTQDIKLVSVAMLIIVHDHVNEIP